MPAYSSMWNAVTLGQSTSVKVTSSARNASCELPVASMTFASPSAAMASRIVAAASLAAPLARAAVSSWMRTSSSPARHRRISAVVSRELREPGFRGGEQLVGHLLEVVEVDAAREGVEHHRLDDLVATPRERGLDGRFLARDD